MAISPFSTTTIRDWSPSDWQQALPVLLAAYNTTLGEGVLSVPVVATIAARAALTTMVAGSLVYVADSGDTTPAAYVYDGSAWSAVWPAAGGGGGLAAASINLDFGATETQNETNVHALYNDNEALNAFPGAFGAVDTAMTVAKPARRIGVTYGPGWLGGAVTVTGTNQAGAPLVEVIAAGDGVTINSVGFFATVTAASKAAVAGIGTGASIGRSFDMFVAPPTGFAFSPSITALMGVGSSFGNGSGKLFAFVPATGVCTYVGGQGLDALVLSGNVTVAP